MPGSEPDLVSVANLVRNIGDQYLGGGQPGVEDTSRKDDGSLVTLIDTAIQTDLQLSLGKWHPEIPLLGEEMSHLQHCDVIQSSSGCFWVLDPLDGTTNYVAGFPFYGVSLALIKDFRPYLAIVYDPVRKELFTAERNKGACLNGEKLVVGTQTEIGECVANVDYKRLTRELAHRLVLSPPYRSQRNLGACVLEWCWLAADRFQIYLHGGQKLWDYAAGLLILEEAGGLALTFDGESIDCSGLGKKSVIAAANSRLQKHWVSWLDNAMRY
ncbi:MAG: myo-inositol-1(or 4)-monophosphatase [Parasphingorhabdus sp.]